LTSEQPDARNRRPLNEGELAVLRHILPASFPGAGELRRQVAAAKVTRNWAPAGSPSVDILVPADVPAAGVSDGPGPVAAEVIVGTGVHLGALLLWVTDGAAFRTGVLLGHRRASGPAARTGHDPAVAAIDAPEAPMRSRYRMSPLQYATAIGCAYWGRQRANAARGAGRS